MDTPLHKLLDELGFNQFSTFSSQELNNLLDDKTADLLKQANILRESIPLQSTFCPNCSNDHEVQYKDKEPYLVCPDGGYISIERNLLVTFRFNTLSFVSLFLKAFGVKRPKIVEKVEGLFWDLGIHKINNKQSHLFFAKNLDDIWVKSNSAIAALPNAIVFHLGIEPAPLSGKVLLIPTSDIIEGINSNGLVLHHDTLTSYLSKTPTTEKESSGYKFPHKLPMGTTWSNITIKFLNDEDIFIQVQQFKHNASYRDLGLVGKGNNPNPRVAWDFLKVLSKLNGELTIKDKEAKDKYKKQKELLTKILQSYFSIDYDPFYPYRSSSEKSGDSYKIKLTLIPPPEIKEEDHPETPESDDLGIKEYLEEQNPQVYEDHQ